MPKGTNKPATTPARVKTLVVLRTKKKALNSCHPETTATVNRSVEAVDKEPHDQSEFEVCPMCLEPIVDASDQAEGHDAIFCEGDGCRAWHHRWCASVTKKRYALLSVSDAPFYCPCSILLPMLRDRATESRHCSFAKHCQDSCYPID